MLHTGSGARSGTKKHLIQELLIRGTTPKEILAATGWKAVSMPAAARSVNLELRKYDEGGVTKYKGVPIAGLSKVKSKARSAKFINRGEAGEQENPTKRGRGKLTRVPFTVSRLTEFCTQKELTNQTGHRYSEWPLVVLKELTDNSLDACEEAGIVPEIDIEGRDNKIIITDNGAGIPAETVESVLNYSVRVSSREAYVSPTRGAQGNALKTILPMSYVLDEHRGDDACGGTIIEAHGLAHHISFSVDHIRQEPKITHAVTRSPLPRGTRITVQLPAIVSDRDEGYERDILADCKTEFLRLAESFAWLNPHLSLRVTWDGEVKADIKRSKSDWSKWLPSWPTSPHWYDVGRFRRYMAAHIAHNDDVTVRRFISEFDGLTSVTKQKLILAATGTSHVKLYDWFGRNKVNNLNIEKLLAVMKQHSSPVPPRALGSIGRDHLFRMLEANGCNPKTFDYQHKLGGDNGVPRVIEIAFGMYNDQDRTRRLITGVNWSPGINNPFRQLGRTGEGLEAILTDARVSAMHPIILIVHVTCPWVQYTDRGKSAIVVDDGADR
jgi:DNA topoisomerase VI subunit B